MKRREFLAGSVSAVTSAAAIGTEATASTAKRRTVAKRSTGPASAHQSSALAIIQNLLAGSALSADVADAQYQSALYADDAVMDVGGGTGEIHGRDAIVRLITDASHSTLRAEGMAHVAAQPYIRISGSRAVAVGYLQIMAPDQAGATRAPAGIPSSGPWVTWRMTANRWELELRADRWQITRRTIRPAPSLEALKLLRLD